MTSDPSATPPSFAPSKVEKAVAKEMRRQTFLSILFVVLLLIPLGLAGFYWVNGRTDRQVVQDEVACRVDPVERMARDVQPALDEVKATSAAARVQQQRVESLVESQEGVRAQLSQLSDTLPKLETSVAQAQELSTRLSELRATLEAHDKSLSSVIESQARIAREQERVAGEVKGLSARVGQAPFEGLDELKRGFEQLNGRMNAIDRRVRDRVVPPPQ